MATQYPFSAVSGIFSFTAATSGNTPIQIVPLSNTGQTYNQYFIENQGTVTAYVVLGSTQALTTTITVPVVGTPGNAIPVLAGSSIVIPGPPQAWFNAQSVSDSPTLIVAGGYGTLSASNSGGGGGGSGSVTSISASNGTRTASGSAITSTGTIYGDHVINAQTGTTYAIVSGDRGKHLTFSNAASIAATLAQAGTTGFEDGYFSILENIGAGALTITPTTSTINGRTSYVLTTNTKGILFSDGTNYRVIAINPHGIAVNAQTGTSYTFLSGDSGSLVTFTNAAAIAGTLPQATGAFAKFWCWIENRGVGTLTITPTISTIDGAASFALTTNAGAMIVSDGTNYFTMRGLGGVSLANANVFSNQQAVTPYEANISGAVSIDLAVTAKSNNLLLTLTGNVTSLAFTNPVNGASYNIVLKEDGTGGWTMAGLSSKFKFGGGAGLTGFVTTANAVNLIGAVYYGTPDIYTAGFTPGLT